ncbi:Flavonol synthase [Rhynchospora pubera]|uniref:anthocyanidin synthase n=1 Tax=Rhynchospora pubera TaxID=906938 RepID=A0AAV8D7J1_9POAL|nr:Flavonol synthase [Rhynchospora pubera]
MGVERVQTIASLSNNLGTIPQEFIRSEHEQPGKTTFHGPVPELPVIDLANPDQYQVTREIVEASSEWGIFQVVNHGIPEEVVKEFQRVGRHFFELPQEEKEKIAKQPGMKEGYGTKLHREPEGKKTWVDFLYHNIWPQHILNYNIWPQSPPEYRKANDEYCKYLVPLVDRLFEYLSTGLGLEKNVLKEASGGDNMKMLLKINYYPPCPRPDLALGVAAHTDMSTFTLLVPNDVPGLQVLKDDHWVDAKYIPNATIVHIGDQFEILSNGKYKSVWHRSTVNKDQTRMSWPVFCEPPADLVIGPLPQLVSDENPAKFKTKKFKDYEYCKLNKIPQ